MRTTVSLPRELYLEAEAAARRLRISRSQLYAQAIKMFLKDQQAAAVTERLNKVYARIPAQVEPAIAKAQLRSIEEDAW